MNPSDTPNRRFPHIPKTVLLVIVLVLGALLVGWWVGQRGTSTITKGPIGSQPSVPLSNSNTPEVTALASYNLPDGWKEASCTGSKSIFVLPVGVKDVACNTNLIAPIKLSVDPNNTKDCNQLGNVSDVKKHTCISLYINGLKSLKASTEFLASSSYKQATTINSYYVDTGKGVVKVEYQYTTDNQYQAGFDQLANSIKAK